MISAKIKRKLEQDIMWRQGRNAYIYWRVKKALQKRQCLRKGTEDEREPKKCITGTLGQESLGKVYRSNALVVRVKKIGVILNIN